ncbi:MAG: hypothetical protein AAF370_12615, partial [Pseudomonadota bacterium]
VSVGLMKNYYIFRMYSVFITFLSFQFHSQTVSNVAIDVLWSLTFYHDQLETFDKDLPIKIIEVSA